MRNSLNKDSILRIIGTVTIVSLLAQLTIDVGDIPITGQTFAVLACAAFLCVEEAVIAMLIYVLLGVIGLPIFADGESGISKLVGGSGGYLIGFVFAAAYVAFMSRRRLPESFLRALGLMTIGTMIILVFGIGRLTHLYGFEKGMEYGFYPFWKGALVKILVGALVVWGGYKLLGKRA